MSANLQPSRQSGVWALVSLGANLLFVFRAMGKELGQKMKCSQSSLGSRICARVCVAQHDQRDKWRVRGPSSGVVIMSSLVTIVLERCGPVDM